MKDETVNQAEPTPREEGISGSGSSDGSAI